MNTNLNTFGNNHNLPFREQRHAFQHNTAPKPQPQQPPQPQGGTDFQKLKDMFAKVLDECLEQRDIVEERVDNAFASLYNKLKDQYENGFIKTRDAWESLVKSLNVSEEKAKEIAKKIEDDLAKKATQASAKQMPEEQHDKDEASGLFIPSAKTVDGAIMIAEKFDLNNSDVTQIMDARNTLMHHLRYLYSQRKAAERRGHKERVASLNVQKEMMKKHYDKLKNAIEVRKKDPKDSRAIHNHALELERREYANMANDAELRNIIKEEGLRIRQDKDGSITIEKDPNAPVRPRLSPGAHLRGYAEYCRDGALLRAKRNGKFGYVHGTNPYLMLEAGLVEEELAPYRRSMRAGTDSYRMFLADQRASGRVPIRPGVYDSTAAHDYQKGIEQHWDVKKSGLGPDDPYRGLSFSPYETRKEMEKFQKMSKKQQKKYAPIHEKKLREAWNQLENNDDYKNLEGIDYLKINIEHALDTGNYQEYPVLFSRFNDIYREIALSRSAAPEVKPNEYGEVEPPKNSIRSVTIDVQDKKGVFDSLKIIRTSDKASFVLAPNNPKLGANPDEQRIYDDMGIKFSIERSKRLRFNKHQALSVTVYATKPGLYEIQKGVTGTEVYTLDARNVTQVINANETHRIDSLNAEQAELLIEKTGENPLVLDSLKKLDAEVAEVFEDFEGPSISLNGLTELSHEAAASLARTDAKSLSLNGLRSSGVDENAIRQLCTFPGALSLGGLRNLPEITDLNEQLLKNIVSLNLNELRSASDIAASIDKSGIGSLKSLSLGRIRTITEKDAKALSKIPEVSLTGLQKDRLDKKTISVLLLDFENIKLPTELTSLESVQDAVRGVVSLEGEDGTKRAKKIAEIAKTAEIDTLHFKSLTKIDLAASDQIAEFVGSIQCDALVTINNEATAKNLVKSKESAAFGGLEHLTAEAAKGLANNPRLQTLSLEKLSDVDADTLKALAKFQGKTLLLNGIEELSAEETNALSSYIGSLSLNGVKTLDEENPIALLNGKERQLSLNSLEELTLAQAQNIGKELGKATKRTIFMDGLDYNGESPDEMNILNALLKNASGNITISLKGLHDPSKELEDLLKESAASIIVSDRAPQDPSSPTP